MKKKTQKTDHLVTRRQFIGGAALSSAAFMVVPGSVLGLRGATSPNGKLNIAGIGIGGQGASDLGNMESENIVALCDVDQNHAAHVFKKYEHAKQFTDYRKMLDEMKEIDAVVVATPYHLHAFASTEGMQMVGSRHDHGVDLLHLVEHLAVIGELLGMFILLKHVRGMVLVHIAQCHDVFAFHVAEVRSSLTSDTDPG